MSEAQNVPNLSRILVAAVCRRARAEGYTTRRSAGPQTWTSTEYRRLTSPPDCTGSGDTGVKEQLLPVGDPF
jgi:hypothetical protein